MRVAAEYGGYSLQYPRRLLRHGKLGDIKIAQLWLINKSALDVCLKRVQNTTDPVLGRSSFYSPINAPYPTVDEISKSITLYVVKARLAVSSIEFPCCLFDESQIGIRLSRYGRQMAIIPPL